MKSFIGPIIALLSTASYAILLPLFKKGGLKIQPFTAMAISMFFLFTVSVALSIVFEKGLQFKFEAHKTGIIFLAIAGLINVAAFWLELLGFKYLPVWQFTLFTLLSPIIAGIGAYFILGEHIAPQLFIGLLIMGVGLYIAVR